MISSFRFLRKTLKAFVVLIGTLFILKDGFNLDIIPFLTGLSIGGVAIALAAQDTIKNFFWLCHDFYR